MVQAPAEMLPLKPGMARQYAFEQQFAPGVKPDLPAGMKRRVDAAAFATRGALYVPGVGMVREVVVQAHNGVMLTRWESRLTGTR